MPEALTRIPTHAAIIVDGNRRWAKNRGLPASFGHKAGFDRLKEITRYAVGDCGIKVLQPFTAAAEQYLTVALVHFLGNGAEVIGK